MIPAVGYVSIQQQPGKYDEEMYNINRLWFLQCPDLSGRRPFFCNPERDPILKKACVRFSHHRKSALRLLSYLNHLLLTRKENQWLFLISTVQTGLVITCSPLSCAACTRLLKQWFGKIMWTKEVLTLIWCPHLDKDMHSLLEWHMLWKFSGMKNYEQLMW